jgi:hypothetical protein
VSLPQHDESAETAKSQSLVTLLGLDDNTVSSRSEAIFIDIPFYRTGFSETDPLGEQFGFTDGVK